MDYAQYEELLRSRMLIFGWSFGILAVVLAVIFLCATIKLFGFGLGGGSGGLRFFDPQICSLVYLCE